MLEQVGVIILKNDPTTWLGEIILILSPQYSDSFTFMLNFLNFELGVSGYL